MNKDKDSFTIIHYELRRKLGVSFKEFLVLEYFYKFSKGKKFNQFIKKITDIEDYTYLSKSQVRHSIDNILEHGWIERPEKYKHIITSELIEVFEEFKEVGKYAKVYHRKRNELDLKVLEFVLLHNIYTFSKDNKGRTMFIGKKEFSETLGIEERQIYNLKNKLLSKKYIEEAKVIVKGKVRDGYYKLSDCLFDWFSQL